MLFPRRWKRKRSPATGPGPRRHNQGWTLGSPWDATETPTIVDAAHARGVSSNSPPPGDPTRPATTGRPGPSPNPDAGQDITAPAVREPDRLVPPGPMTVQWHPDGTGPVPTVDGPVRHRPRKVLARTLGKAWGDSLFGLSSQAAFWSALSTPPFLLALLGLVGYVAPWFGPGTMTDVRAQITLFLHTIFNQEVTDTLVGNTVETILNNGQAGVVSVGLLISLWAGSSAMSAFIESITIAYGQHEFRHPVVERLYALGLYLIALAAGILLVPLLAIGPDNVPRLFPVVLRPAVTSIVGYAYYPGLTLGLLLLLTTLYKVAPQHRHPWKRGLPGAFLAAVFFLVASGGLRLYLSYVYSHGLTYGALATPITFLLFYYFAAMAIILGAQFNNALLEYYPPKTSRRRARKQRRNHPNQGSVRNADDSALDRPG